MLNVTSSVEIDKSISKEQFRHFSPFNLSALGPSDEIRISINHMNSYTALHKSAIYIEGQLIKPRGGSVKFSNNAFSYLFEEVRLELGGIEIDKTRNVGISSTIKNYVCCNESTIKHLQISGWGQAPLMDSDGNFTVIIPLRSILGFAEDFDKILLNMRQELVLIRSRQDNDVIQDAGESVKLELFKVQWRVPFVEVATEERAQLKEIIDRDIGLYLPFRSWELYEYPELPMTTNQSWTVKTTTQLEKPRYVIVAFQTDRRNNFRKSASEFDHCNIRSIALHLNSDVYPYETLNVNFHRNSYSLLYDMYASFQPSFRDGVDTSQPLLNLENFKSLAPLIVIDCSKQNEEVPKNGPVDIRLEFEFHTQVVAKTAMYCMIVHDRIVQYFPSTGTVKKM